MTYPTFTHPTFTQDALTTIRLSFCEPIDFDTNVVSMSVDTPAGGPLVVRACRGDAATGELDAATERAFLQRVTAASRSGRSLVIDLLDVERPANSTVIAIEAAAHRLRRNGSRIVLACRPDVHRRTASWGADIEHHDTLTRAIAAAITRDNTVAAPASPAETALFADSVVHAPGSAADALHGTYF